MKPITRRRLNVAALSAVVLAALALAIQPLAMAGQPQGQWWRGNTHTHTRWSDGVDFPEIVAGKYKAAGYNFLVHTDHNILMSGTRWSAVKAGQEDRLEEYRKRFPDVQLQERQEKQKDKDKKTEQTVRMVQPRALADWRGLYEEPGRFILIQGQEITGRSPRPLVHMVALPITEVIEPQKGATQREQITGDLAAVMKQASAAGRQAVAILCHPNWGGVVPVEEFAPIGDLRFFEVTNGVITDADNIGDADRLSTDRLWDVVMARRVESGLPPIYGISSDDVHDTRTGMTCGWVMVRAPALKEEAIVAAMLAGDFYATSGVRLKDIRREGPQIIVEIDPEQGVTYRTQFIGTLPGYDRSKEDAKDDKGKLLPPTQRYSPDIGKVLAEVEGTTAKFKPKGNELYVRAKVISTKIAKNPDAKKNPAAKETFESAWTQPLVISAPKN